MSNINESAPCDEQERKKRERRIIEVLEQLRPYIQHDGGDLEFVSYENNVVHIKLYGACVGCGLVDITLQDGIKSYLKEEVDGIDDVVLDNPYGDNDIMSAFYNDL